MAGRCLGELVRKMGDRVLQQIIPILVRGMQDPQPSTRQGVCTGLKEVLDNITREQLQEYLAQLLPTVQAALCDEDTTVRQVSAYLLSATTAMQLAEPEVPYVYAKHLSCCLQKGDMQLPVCLALAMLLAVFEMHLLLHLTRA